MLSRWARQWAPKFFHPIVHRLICMGVTANSLTTVGLVFTGVSGIFIAFNQLLTGAVFLLLSAACDSLDGELARQQPVPNRLGGFIDSVADHYGDFAIYFGLTWRAMNGGDHLTAFLVFVAMFGSLVGSQVRSRAGMIGIDTQWAGLFTRMERTIVILLGLVSGFVLVAAGVLAVATNFSALQRVVHVLKNEGKAYLS